MQEENNNYSVYEHITPDGMYYFGVTTNVKQRWRNNGVYYKGTSLWSEIEKWGWDNIQHQVLFENQTRENALWIEDFLIKTAQEDGVCINKNRSGLVTKTEDYNTESQRKYYNTHREDWNAYQREYKREFYKTHREEWNTYQREYQRKRYHRKKDLKTLNELGYIPLF